MGGRVRGLRGAAELRALDRIIGVVLRWGVLIAAAIILAGIVLFVHRSGVRMILLAPPGIPPGLHTNPSSVQAVWQNLNYSHPSAITALGLLVLIATPVLSVAIAAAAYVLEQDWLYAGIGLFVFAMLLLSFALGKA